MKDSTVNKAAEMIEAQPSKSGNFYSIHYSEYLDVSPVNFLKCSSFPTLMFPPMHRVQIDINNANISVSIYISKKDIYKHKNF
jgi:hypothetical protein